MTWLEIRLGVWVACAAAVSSLPTQAIEALSFPNEPNGIGGTAGFMAGGAGWSFVPTTNLLVTGVGYLDLAVTGGDPEAVVTIWSGTNAVVASYTGITDSSALAGEIVSTAIPPLPLVKGQPYTITVHATPLSGSVWYGSFYDNLGLLSDAQFQVAAELAGYQAWLLKTNSTFVPLSSDPVWNQELLWLGPTFTYEVGIPRPTLTIARTNNNRVLLTWPTNAVGFGLQGSIGVTGAYSSITNFSVAGTNYLAVFPHTNAASFFRLVKQP